MVSKESVRAIFYKFDWYALDVGLFYRNDNNYRTIGGALFSIMTAFFIVWFSFQQMAILFGGNF
jgi:hypothetical protein